MNIVEKGENNLGTESEKDNADNADDELDNFKLYQFGIDWWENFVYPSLKIHEKSFTHPFLFPKFLLPNPFLFGTNPSVNNKQSLITFEKKDGEQSVIYHDYQQIHHVYNSIINN